jgi:flagellar protein FlaG
MTFEIGQLTLGGAAAPAPAPSSPSATAAPVPGARAAVVDVADVIPASPPPDVLAEVERASARASDLAAQNRELHFRRDEATGRTIIEVRTLEGEVLRTIPPSKWLDVMAGGEL